MRPLLTALWLVRGDTHGKRWLIREAHKLLSGEAGDEDAEGYARALVADGVLGDQLPSWRTMEGWFERVDIQDMIDCGVDDDWVP
ncbi:MAG: hypothetical protein Q8R02_17050 [Hyphomonadaceae bacterium]|nr:hypothetical protein [Hyphomonadaceae bacterium]